MRRLRVLGHPIHPPLVHLPFGLLLAAPILLGIGWSGGGEGWVSAARYALDLGLIATVPAAPTGLLDLAAIRSDHPGLGAAFLHLGAMGTAWIAYAAARLTWDRPGIAAGALAVGVISLLIGGAVGGHLVYVHRVAGPED